MASTDDLERVLGHDRLRRDGEAYLAEQKRRCLVLDGPSGSGKTWLASQIGASLSDATSLFAVGDALRRSEDFAPFECLTRNRSGLEQVVVQGGRVVAGAGSFLSGFGALGATVFDWAVNASKALIPSSFEDFTEDEWKWLGKLRRMSRGKPVVLIADNIHWWDEASFTLLKKLSEVRDWQEEAFLASLKLIVVRTTDPGQTDYLGKDFDRWSERVDPARIELKKCTLDQFAEAISCFGARTEFDQSILKDLYDLSAGNLKLAKLLAQSLLDGSNAQQLAEDAASVGLLRTLLSERFKTRDGKVEEVLSTLKSAALIGVYFYRAEATCLASKNEDDSDVRARLEHAQATGLIEIDGDKYFFAHPVILDFVQRELSPSEVSDLSGKLARCLRLLRPADYRRQVDLFVAGADEREAAQSAALHLIQRCRLHEYRPEDTPSDHWLLIDTQGLKQFCKAMMQGYAEIADGSHASALVALETVGDPIHPGLYLELTYIRSLCRMESGRREDAAYVAEELGRHLNLEDVDEFAEISTRLQLLRQQALVLAGTVEKARVNSVSLMNYLRKRAAVDQDAETKYHQLLRKSNTIHDPFVAKAHLQQARAFFSPARLSELPEYPLEYYRTLVNLSGVEIQLGHWEDAIAAAEEAFALVAANTVFSFPRLDVPLNNLNVARVRAHLDPIEQSVVQQRKVVSHSQAMNDNFQHRSNLAGMHILEGDLAAAGSDLDALEEEFASRTLSELYITFHLKSRRQVLTYLEGDADACTKQQSDLMDLLQGIDWPSRPALLRRQEMLQELIGTGDTLSSSEFDTWFVNQDATGTGPSWPHFGRGVQFSELQFWSDS